MAEIKQAIVVRTDLKMSCGKTAAQCSHAAVEVALKVRKSRPGIFGKWRRAGMKKVVLKAKNLKELQTFQKQATRAKIKNAMIKDAGFTELRPGTVTCLAIGPDDEKKIE